LIFVRRAGQRPTNGKLARSSELILKDNYRSVLAAQRMKGGDRARR